MSEINSAPNADGPATRTNPYAPTAETGRLEPGPHDVEEFRRAYLSHEASVKSIGWLYLLGGFVAAPLGFLIVGLAVASPQDYDPIDVVIGLAYSGLGVFQGWVGIGLRRLQNWARIATIVFSTIGLLAVPIGTIIAAYILYLLLSAKGRVVFSQEYKTAVLQTPHIKYKTSIIVWILVALLLAFLAFAVLGVFFAA